MTTTDKLLPQPIHGRALPRLSTGLTFLPSPYQVRLAPGLNRGAGYSCD